jgi:hypothetical protein
MKCGGSRRAICYRTRRVDVSATTSDTNNFLFASFIFPKFTVVAIRGTAPILQDIAIDLKEMMLLKGGEGYHMGFYNEAQRALLPLREAENEELYLHSLGGALFGLLAKMWPGPEKPMIPYTFGSPRFCNQRTARSHPVYSFIHLFVSSIRYPTFRHQLADTGRPAGPPHFGSRCLPSVAASSSWTA